MKLVGMFDSPYVRRVAISMLRLNVPFEHLPLSVFRDFDEFSKFSSVVKAPSLICDDGSVLTDSTLILQYVEMLAAPRSLWPEQHSLLQLDLRLIGLALVACEKSVQLVYEQAQRPVETRFEPWRRRLGTQLHAALVEIESAFAGMKQAEMEAMLKRQAGITTAVTWLFSTRKHPELVTDGEFPSISKFSRKAEAQSEFLSAPFG